MFEIDSSINSEIIYNYNSVNNIEVLDSTNVSYDFFFRNFMLPNIPCIIQNCCTNWKCSKLWIIDAKNLNISYLQEKYGLDSVFVYNCKEKYYNSQKYKTIKFKDYLSGPKNDDISTSFPRSEYLKNWHLKLNHCDDNFYEVPIFFASDWLNEFYIENTNDDYRFVYMGPNETW